MSLDDLVKAEEAPEPKESEAIGEPIPLKESSSEADASENPQPLNVGTTNNSPSENPADSSPDAPTVIEQPNDPWLDAILDKIAPVGQVNAALKVLIYSEPGVGKSVFAGTADNNLIIDVEKGLMSLANHPDLVKPNVKGLPYKSFGGLEIVVDRLNKRVDQLEWVETVSVDTVSELHKRGLAETMERDYRLNPEGRNRYLAETEHHTENNEHIRRLVSSFRDLDRNLILLAHSRTIEPKNEMPRTFPDFSEKLANTLAGIMDIVGYMYLKPDSEGKIHRILRLQGNGQITAKTRIGGYPDELIDPTWDDLYDAFLTAKEKSANAS